MNHWLILALFAVWSGVAWRFRGGAFTTLTGINPGTDGARALGAVMIGAPLAGLTHHWLVLTIVPAIVVGLMLTGWGPFQGMGTEPASTVPEKSWLRWLPSHLGLPPNHFGQDFVGMGLAGLVCLLPVSVCAVFLGPHPWAGAFVAAVGAVGFPLAYTLALVGFPTIPRFATGQSWGEVFAGAILGAALFIALGLAPL